MSLCVSPRLPACGPRPCLECVHASEYELMSTCLPMSAPFPIDSFMEIYVPLCVCPSHPTCGPTLWLECVHASVHEFRSSWLPISAPPCMHSLMETGCLCMPMCLCPSHLICVATPCLECVHALVHAFMSTWLSMSAPPCMHSLMETWVPLYASVFVSQSPNLCSYTLFRMCTCISTCIYVHLTAHICSTLHA